MNGTHSVSRKLCEACENRTCVNECYAEALRLCGYTITTTKLYEIIKRDRQYWGANGGVTLTGGEPLLQIGFATEILSLCHKSYIHTVVETCGNVPWSNLSDVLHLVDWIFYDIKHMNGDKHKIATNADNSLVLSNAKQLSDKFNGRLIFRIPLIPGYNDTEENLENTISFVRETGRKEVNILPLHHLGKEKYKLLDRKYFDESISVPSGENMLTIQKLFAASSITCYLGSQTPF